MKSFCANCNRPTNQTILKQEELNYYEEDTTWWENNKYQIIQCGGCDEISFRKIYSDAQMNQTRDENDAHSQELYPKRGPNSVPIRTFHNIPLNIRGLYRETVDAYNNEQLILCTAGIRAMIEGICLDKKIIGINVITKKGKTILKNSLEGKIDGLAESGYLTKDNATSLHELRFLGNEALHELSRPSVAELKLVIEIIELTLDNIYELQHKAMRLKNAKMTRKK